MIEISIKQTQGNRVEITPEHIDDMCSSACSSKYDILREAYLSLVNNEESLEQARSRILSS